MTMRAAEGVAVRAVIDASGQRVQISPVDRGLSLGDALFETVRIYDGIPFRLRAHMDRLQRSARHMSIVVPRNLDHEIETVLAECATLGMSDARLRITLTRGAASAPGLGFADEGESRSTIVLAAD